MKKKSYKTTVHRIRVEVAKLTQEAFANAIWPTSDVDRQVAKHKLIQANETPQNPNAKRGFYRKPSTEIADRIKELWGVSTEYTLSENPDISPFGDHGQPLTSEHAKSFYWGRFSDGHGEEQDQNALMLAVVLRIAEKAGQLTKLPGEQAMQAAWKRGRITSGSLRSFRAARKKGDAQAGKYLQDVIKALVKGLPGEVEQLREDVLKPGNKCLHDAHKIVCDADTPEPQLPNWAKRG